MSLEKAIQIPMQYEVHPIPFFSRPWSEAELQSQLERDAYNVLLSDGKLLLSNRMKLTESLWRDMKKLSSENMDTALTLSGSTAI